MSVYIDAQSRLHHAPGAKPGRDLSPLPGDVAITPMAVPQYEQLMAFRPKQVGIVFRCDSATRRCS